MENGQMADETAIATAQLETGRSEPIREAYRFARQQTKAHWTFIKFMLSGVVGYVLYQGALLATYDIAGVQFFTATIVAAQVSITGGFFVRDLWVFTDGPVVQRSLWARFMQYQAKSLVSTLVIVTATVNVLTSGFDVPHYVSTPIGVALGFAWNWGWERGFIWRPQAHP